MLSNYLTIFTLFFLVKTLWGMPVIPILYMRNSSCGNGTFPRPHSEFLVEQGFEPRALVLKFTGLHWPFYSTRAHAHKPLATLVSLCQSPTSSWLESLEGRTCELWVMLFTKWNNVQTLQDLEFFFPQYHRAQRIVLVDHSKIHLIQISASDSGLRKWCPG